MKKTELNKNGIPRIKPRKKNGRKKRKIDSTNPPRNNGKKPANEAAPQTVKREASPKPDCELYERLDPAACLVRQFRRWGQCFQCKFRHAWRAA